MPGTRTSEEPLLEPFNEVERVFHSARRQQQESEQSSGSNSAGTEGTDRENNTEMADRNDLPMDNLMGTNEALPEPAIMLTNATRNLDIKNHLFHQIPKFYGMANEDVMTYLRDVNAFIRHITKPADVTDDDLRMKVMAMGLGDKAKTWLGTLPPGSLDTWKKLYAKFLERYFPHSKTQALRSQISNFKQLYDESLFEAWERYRGLLAQCPHHGFEKYDWLLIFFNGLDRIDQNLVNSSIGGNIYGATKITLRQPLRTLRKLHKTNMQTRGAREHQGWRRTWLPMMKIGSRGLPNR